MGVMKYYDSPYDAIEKFKHKTNINWPMARALIETGKEFYIRGYYFVEHNYILKNNLLVLNRSTGAESNFFVFIKPEEDGIDIFFSNPSKKEVRKEELIVHNKIKKHKEMEEILSQIRITITKIDILSKMKELNEYWGCLHSHIGRINKERVWDDGITEDENWFLQSMLWHHDFHALTSHNWTHNEERLKFMDDMCSSANITFIPGWENTTTVEDRVKSPHILVLCKDIQTAMKAKYEFLSKKLEGNKETVTPVLTGVPGPYQRHLEYIKSLHDNLNAAVIIAHPSSKNPGIDILDPDIVSLIGEKETLRILFEFADGVEQFNLKEVGTGHTKSKIISDIIPFELLGENYPPSHMVINWLVGLKAKEKGLLNFINQDDHYQPSIDSSLISDYSQGYNSLVLPPMSFNYFRSLNRKFNSEEFVYSLIKRKIKMADSDSEIEIKPVAFLKIREGKDIEFYESRKKSIYEKIKEWININPSYYWNIAKLQFKYWFGSKDQKKEIRTELEKAKSYNESPNQI